ncbi:MAG TPA: urease accessory UreF family protein, partial [Verrucomicrobiae bacterium]|nr:urease accessory UreF family protein [Verrucomicrobiae bacterium]
SDSLHVHEVKSLPALRNFLEEYHAKILVPLELPAIQHAFFHSSRNELRELIALDQRLAGEPRLHNFAAASRRVGQGQLQRLRPLRDLRIVQRYLAAVDSGEAHGWHTLVYGLTLAVYSLPLRQGLLGYAHQTTRGFIHSAGRSLKFSEKDSRNLLRELCAPFPAAVDSLLAPALPPN